jgi:hypothetical protein
VNEATLTDDISRGCLVLLGHRDEEEDRTVTMTDTGLGVLIALRDGVPDDLVLLDMEGAAVYTLVEKKSLSEVLAVGVQNAPEEEA